MVLKLITLILSIVICLLVFLLGTRKRNDEAEKKHSRISEYLRRSNIKAFNYEETQKMLVANGVINLFPSLTPSHYQICRVILGVVFVTIGSFVLQSIGISYPILAIFLFPLGFPAANGIMRWMNKIDNDDMMPDIRKMYDTMKIQSKAGMYLTESLMEIYRVVSHKRLKRALLELNGQLFIKNQVDEAIDCFQQKFNNEYIDMFCITVKQAEQSGQSVHILDDISGQLVAVQKQIHKKEEDSLNRKLLVMQMMIFITIMVITIVLLVRVLSNSMNF